MLKRRLKQAGLPAHYSPHSFRGNTDHNILNSCAKRVDSVRQSRILLFYKPPQCHYGNRHLQSIVAVQTCDCRRPNWGRRPPLSGLAGLPDVGGLDGFEGLAVDLLGPYIDFLF